jgi:enterochelin esterase-like enzyme
VETGIAEGWRDHCTSSFADLSPFRSREDRRYTSARSAVESLTFPVRPGGNLCAMMDADLATIKKASPSSHTEEELAFS